MHCGIWLSRILQGRFVINHAFINVFFHMPEKQYCTDKVEAVFSISLLKGSKINDH